MKGRNTRHFLLAAAVVSCIALTQRLNAVTGITADNLTDAQVTAAIDAIVEELYERKHVRNFWEPRAGRGDGSQYQVGGYTALVVLSLLYAGESYQNPRLRDAIEHLKVAELQGTYAVAVRASVWAMLPPRFHEHLVADAQWLMNGFSEEVGGWAYYQLPTTTRRDNSLRQYGALGLWDAARRGVRVPPRYWEALERAYLDMQLADGGWNYTGSGRATGSMTAAGLGTLLIIQDFLRRDDYVSLNDRRRPHSQQAIDAAVRWMDENFSPTDNPGQNRYFYYYLYGVERVGLIGGYKYFGGYDWYREGAAELIRRFCAWDAENGLMTMHERVYGDGNRAAIRNDDLAFGLMFLSRGRLPSIINKLQDDDASWNNRPRDVPNLAIWIGSQSARHVLWQVTNINAPPKEWLDAPMMYMASNQPVTWTQPGNSEQLERVKKYLDLGGLLFAVNEGSGRAFAESIEAAGRMMYPQYKWRSLPADHWAYTIHQPVRANRPRLRALSNGVRDLVIIAIDGDMPATFQSRNTRQSSHYHTASNIYFYASEMDRPRSRLAALAPTPVGNDWPRAGDFSAHIVRASHSGNWNPEPQALAVFKQWLAQRDDIAVTLSESPLAEIHTINPMPTLVVVSGVQQQSFTAAEREAIRRFAEAGGVILFETPGGLGEFAGSAEWAVDQIVQRQPMALLRSRIITGEGLKHALDLSRVEYRPYTMDVVGALDTTPRLRGVTLDGQPRILFSRDDISHALLDQPCWGINGYSPESARRLLRNILLHAADLR